MPNGENHLKFLFWLFDAHPNVARVFFLNLEEVSQKKTLFMYCQNCPPTRTQSGQLFTFWQIVKITSNRCVPPPICAMPKRRGVFFWDSFPNHCENNNNDCDNDNDYYHDNDVENDNMPKRLMVVGAWLLTLVLASPQVNKQVQIVPKKVPNRNTCCCHSRIWNYTKRAPLLISISIFGIFSNAPVKTFIIFSPGGDLEGLEAPKTRLLPSMILTMLRVWKWPKSKSRAIWH